MVETRRDLLINNPLSSLELKRKKIESKGQYSESVDQKLFNGPKVAVIDNFGDKVFPIDPYDKSSDMTHGSAVESYIKKECPNANIKQMGKFNPTTQSEINEFFKKTKKDWDGASPEAKILFGEGTEGFLKNPSRLKHMFNSTPSLNKLNQSINQGEKIDAVNISATIGVRIDDLAKVTGLPLTRDNLKAYNNEVRNWFKETKIHDLQWPDKNLRSVENITQKGVPVFIAAGNDGPDYVNLYSFAKGVTIVGALKEDDKTKTPYSGDNSLVSGWARGDYPITQVKNQDGKIGYDINADNKIDIPEENVTGHKTQDLQLVNSITLIGTSNASPAFTGKYLRQKGLCTQ